ncbi:MAG: GNAT family N-acetyltransferase [Pseudomonadota bacterium]
MKFELYRPQDLSAEQWQTYAALRDARAIYDDPFFDPDFARMVGEVRDDTRIGFASDKGGVFAVWALHIRPGNWARPIGAPFSDWHGPIVSEDTEISAQEILSGFDISGITSQGFQPLRVAATPGMTRKGANITSLAQGWDAYFDEQQTLWPKHFKKMRRVYRNVEREFQGFEFRWSDRTDATFQRLMTLKRAQYARTGLYDVLNAPWTQALFDRLRRFEGRRLRARLSSLHFGEEFAAAELNLQSNTVLHGWITAFDPSFGTYSPGNMLMQEVLRAMSQHGLDVYDSGPGLDHYKRHYSNLQLPIESGVLSGSAVPLTPARVAGKVWRIGEQIMPSPAGSLMARARRRMDQIAAVDTSFKGRAGGFIKALQNRPVS